MGMTYNELSVYGRLRKIQKCGPYGMFVKLVQEWGSVLSPVEVRPASIQAQLILDVPGRSMLPPARSDPLVRTRSDRGQGQDVLLRAREEQAQDDDSDTFVPRRPSDSPLLCLGHCPLLTDQHLCVVHQESYSPVRPILEAHRAKHLLI